MRGGSRLRPPSLFALIALAFGSLFTGAVPASAVGECGPLDVGFVIDVTGSMGGALGNVQAESSAILDQINDASAGDFQLALLSFEDFVTVHDDLAAGSRATVESDIQGLTIGDGFNAPEASDEALNTAVNGLDEANRDPGQQFGDFNGTWRPSATKILILITDALPGGFDDTYTAGVDDVNAHNVAVAAAGFGMLISAVYVPTGGVDPTVSGIMQDYATTTGGVYVETASDGTGTSSAISNVIAGCGGGGTTTGTIPPGGGTVASPPLGNGVTQRVVVTAKAGTPGGNVTIQIPDPNDVPCPDVCYGAPMHVTGFDTGSASNRLILRFVFARGVIPKSVPLWKISMLRNEVQVPRCREERRPDPCQRSITRARGGRVTIVIASSDETDPRYRGH